jgi:hypothetical protein
MSAVRRHRGPEIPPEGAALAAIVSDVSQAEGLLQGLKSGSRGWRARDGSATSRNRMSEPGPLLPSSTGGHGRHKLPSAAIVHDGRK